MITMTATIARITNSAMSRGDGCWSVLIRPAGAWLTMPAKMMKLMPLPMPFSVMSSPSHMSTIAPASSVIIWTHDWALPRPKSPMITSWAARADRMPNACRSAIGTVR